LASGCTTRVEPDTIALQREEATVAGIENPKYAREMAELRRSNAAGTHGDRRTKRNRDRSSQRRRAINDARE
jgi:hypothetical protein